MALPFILDILARIDKVRDEPIGVVRPWPNSTAPIAWIECDGRALEAADFPQVSNIIGTRFGDGSTGIGSTGSTDFNLPDMRGRFIRGYDNGAGNDPDTATRGNNTDAGGTSISGQVTGDNIGSIQGDTIKRHTHTTTTFPNGQNDTGGGAGGVGAVGNSSSTGGNEARPQNISMMYIIRV